uniref:MuF-C-terminal domain-containing protein n=1 Tax=Butyrivibrio sp. AE3004 TaxID=1506994 RepID=UPI0018CBFE9A
MRWFSGIVMTNLIDNKGNPVIAPIHMDKDSHMGNVNEVASMYGRNKIENLLENSDILYENKEKARDALSGVGLQLPELKTTADPFLNSNVAEQGKNINNALPTLEDLLPRAAEKQATQDMIPGAELFTDSNAAKPQITNDTAMTTEDLWAQLSGQKPLNEAGVRRVGEGTPYNEQGQKLSKLHQTLQNTDKLTDEEKRIFADKNGFWYDPDNEKALAAQAQDSVSRDIDEVYRQYTGDDLDIGKLSGEDAHKMFTASYDYSRMAQEAVKNGDQAAADLYNQKARNIMLNAREAATKGGQFNAAIRYYSNTPQGIINKAYDVLDKDITKFKT